MNNVSVIEHPLIDHYLTRLRDKKAPTAEFKVSLDRLSYLIAAICYSELKSEKHHVSTPLKKTSGTTVRQPVVLVPILRAGLGLTRGFIDLYPEIIVSHIGLYRDEESLKPIKYYFKFPAIRDKKNARVFIIDPMIATGGSIIFTLEYILNMGFKNISVVSLLLAPEGIKAIEERFSVKEKRNFHIYTCSIDEKLNQKGYIVPGLGDAGDRLFGTL
jgi:uracil phosphoribosyltransferase